jgi:branched-subunit amino acid ABC-type transport system permease component
VAGLLAGIAGVLVLYTAGMDFASGMSLTLAGFGAAIVFGLQGPLRGFFGGLAIGIVDVLEPDTGSLLDVRQHAIREIGVRTSESNRNSASNVPSPEFLSRSLF